MFEACLAALLAVGGNSAYMDLHNCQLINNQPEFQEAISQSNSKVMACSVIPLPQKETVLLSAGKANCDLCPVVDLLRHQLLGELHPSTAIQAQLLLHTGISHKKLGESCA